MKVLSFQSEAAMIRVLGAIAYGELKAYEGLCDDAARAPDAAERRTLRTFAAQELRHHKGFVARLEALGADPERAMRPYRRALDHYHGRVPDDPVEEAVFSYFGEGIADDLLRWLQRVADPETVAFVDTVIADEVQHEGHATDALRAVLDREPDGRRRAARAARTMIGHLLASGAGPAAVPLLAFVQVGRVPDLLGAIVGGYRRQLRAIGVFPTDLVFA